MASLNTFTAQPASVPFGGSADVTVTFNTQPGATYDVTLHQDGVQAAAGTVTFEGEPVPVVQANGVSGQGWELRTTGGTLTALGNNTFRLVA